MARFAILALICATAYVARVESLTFTEYGMKMAVRGFDLVCWYENLKQFPNTNTKGFMSCSGQAEFQRKYVSEQIHDEDSQQKYFGQWLIEQGVIASVPSEYGDACQKYLTGDKIKAEPPADESNALRDSESSVYPFKAFANCMVHKIRSKFGDSAIEAIKNEKTHKKKNWMSTLLDRDNEFRARHGSNPMKLMQELNEEAQRWADKMAAECNMYHSKNDYSDRQWNGESTGESLSASGGDFEKADSAYIASDGWYEENKDYPWPEYTGDGTDSQFMAIGHFTQSVWKETKYVGYGYARNPDCGNNKIYIAGRYSPAGNMPGDFKKNVLPPKKT